MNNISYELAKQLKNAGFPQHEGTLMRHPSNHSGKCIFHVATGELTCVPTLSELIEACGEKLYVMTRALYHENGSIDVTNGWACNGMTSFGSTPEEAVAKLWLELNKK